jgi:hypothetical protein
MFTFVSAVVRSADGRIFVADRDATIRIYDAEGKHISGFGGSGEGPGEFRFLRTMFSYRGDSILAADAALRRISVFDSQGKFGRSFPNPVGVVREEGGIPSQSCCLVAGVFPDGSILVEPPEFLPNTPGGPRYGRLTLLRLSADGARLDTIGRFPSRRLTYDAAAPNKIRIMHFTPPFTYAVLGDRLYGGNGEHARLTVVGANGQSFPDVPLSIPRVPVTGAVRKAFGDSLRAAMARNPGFYEGPVESYLAGEFPDTMPAFVWVLVDRTGTLWLAAPALASATTPTEFHIVSSTGQLLGRIRLPEKSVPYWLGRDEVVVVQRDESDVQYVRVYRLIR